MKNKYLKIFNKIILSSLFATFFALLLVARYLGAREGLPDYFIDDPAVGIFSMKYLLGDFDPGFYQYGPLYSYLLAIVYYIYLLFSSYDLNSFVQDYFFNPYNYYLIARLSSSVVIVMLAFLTSYLSAKLYNKKVALVVLFLAIFPFIDNLIDYHVKVDTLLAVWALFAVYYSIKINQTGSLKYYIITGLFIGLGFATKPFPALLVLPTVFLSHFFSQNLQGSVIKKKNVVIYKIKNNIIKKITSKILNIKLFVLTSASIFFSFLFNPYLLVHLGGFYSYQAYVLSHDTHLQLPKGWSFLSILSDDKFLGYCFIIISIIAFIYYIYKYIKTKNFSYLIIVSYPIVFWCMFAPFPSRAHFFAPIIPILFIMISKLIIDISEKIKYSLLRYAFVLCVLLLLFLQPGFNLYKRTLFLKRYPDPYKSVATVAGKYWIEENIPAMSKIFMNGYYAALPRLVNYDIEKHMDYDEAFAYGHDDNKLYAEMYKESYNKYKKAGGVFYDIDSSKANRSTDWEKLGYNQDYLFEYCMKNNYDYVITSYPRDLDKYPEFDKRKVTEFNANDYPLGRRFKIYKLK